MNRRDQALAHVDKLAEFSKDTQYCASKFTLAADPGAKIAAAYDTHLSLVGVKLPPGTNLQMDLTNRTSYELAPSLRQGAAGLHQGGRPDRPREPDAWPP